MALGASTLASQAALTALVGGDFSTGHGSGPIQVSNWFESTDTGYNDWITSAGEQAQQTGNTGATLAISTDDGYVYQAIGTRGLEDTATITGTLVERTAGGGTNPSGNLDFSIFQGSGTVGDGIDITGFTQIGSTVTSLAGTAGAAFSLTPIDLTSANTTDTLYLRINRAGSNEAYGEDLAISYTSVPEPSSTALLGLGGLLILRRRK